jgi:hypothetical protein
MSEYRLMHPSLRTMTDDEVKAVQAQNAQDLELISLVRAHPWSARAVEMFKEEADFLSYHEGTEGKVEVYRMLVKLLTSGSKA